MDAVAVKQAIEAADQALSGRGRVLVRASGTEPTTAGRVRSRPGGAGCAETDGEEAAGGEAEHLAAAEELPACRMG